MEELNNEKSKMTNKASNNEHFLDDLSFKLREILKETKEMKPDPEIFKK